MIDVRIDSVDHDLTVNKGLKKYRGGSDETKPTENICPGSTFHEWDTGDLYMYDGTNWIKQDANERISS